MRLLSVIRRPQVIVALLCDRARPFKLDEDDEAYDELDAAADARGDAPYREHVVPLTQVPEALCPWRDKDLRVWRALARVPALERRAGMAVVRAIIGSVADPELVPASVGPISFSAGAIDLRPHLCAPTTEQAILDGLGSVLDEVSNDSEFPSWHWTRRHSIAALPAAFRLQFLWHQHTAPWKQIELTLAVYEALELDRAQDLRLAVARLLSLADRSRGLEWARVLLEVAPEDRLRACENVIEHGVYRGEPTADLRRALAAREWGAVCAVGAAGRSASTAGV